MKVKLLRTPGKRDFPELDVTEGQEASVDRATAERLEKAGLIVTTMAEPPIKAVPESPEKKGDK